MTTALGQLRRLWDHAAWSDDALRLALHAASQVADAPATGEALREYAHLLGAEETWLARIEGRAATAAVWPALSLADAESLGAATRAGYGRLFAELTDARLDDVVAYTNSAGQSFANTVGEILLHVALHGQYHRGKINLLLRQGGAAPAPADYIAFVRGAAAARTAGG